VSFGFGGWILGSCRSIAEELSTRSWLIIQHGNGEKNEHTCESGSAKCSSRSCVLIDRLAELSVRQDRLFRHNHLGCRNGSRRSTLERAERIEEASGGGKIISGDTDPEVSTYARKNLDRSAGLRIYESYFSYGVGWSVAEMVRHIGIVAVSSEGAALCYRTICQEAPKLMGRFAHPEISMHTHSLEKYMAFLNKNDWDGVASLLIDSVNKVAACGADFAVIPDNTVHRVFDEVSEESPIPLISISENVADECRSRGYRTVGVLGTSWIMQGSVYRKALGVLRITMVVPDKEGQEIVNSIIFDELVAGEAKQSSAALLIKEIEKLKARGCQAVVLGCTEIPIVINPGNSPVPVLDSTRLLARKALDYALK